MFRDDQLFHLACSSRGPTYGTSHRPRSYGVYGNVSGGSIDSHYLRDRMLPGDTTLLSWRSL